MQLARAVTVLFSRLSWRSSRRSWSREERESMGPRRLREGRKRAVTRPLEEVEEEQRTPRQAARQASEPVQLERRWPWVSAWRRKIVRALVSLGGEERE